MKQTLTIIFAVLCSVAASAQTGIIKGTIKDATTQEAIIGASVVIQGTTTGAATDVEGNFTIPKVNAGVHSVVISYVSYKTNTLANVRVEAGKATVINSTLAEDAKNLQEVVVRAQRLTNTEVAVITEIKQAEQIAVGISSEQISKSQDRDASQIIRRVPGVSIMDDRFVMVRGLNERYNTVMLNDVITPSTEVDVKSFSFDLIPSSAIDRMLIFKSGSAELPGEFAGGVIKIYTKTIPDANSFSIGLSTSYRSGTTFKNVTDYKGSGLDWLGFGNADRKLPSRFPSQSILSQGPTESNLTHFRRLPVYFDIANKTVMPDLRFNLGFTRRFNLGNIEITNISGINYTFAHQFIPDINQLRYEAQTAPQFRFRDQLYQENVRLGAMSNWGFIINPRNKIEFRNLYNQIGTKETVLRGGENDDTERELNNYAFRYESKSIYSGQLGGTHELNDLTTVKWTGGFGYTHREEPDYRRFGSSRPLGQTELPFVIDVPPSSNASLTQAARFYSTMNEYAETIAGHIERRINKGDSSSEDMQIKLRAGVYLENKNRDFAARWFGYVNPNNTSLPNLPPAQFYNPANIAADKVYYAEGTNTDDKYEAQNLLLAGYVGAYVPLSRKVNMSLGLRVEQNRQQLQSQQRGSGVPVDVDNPIFRPLPSLNVAYNFSEKTLFRLAYSLTLNRPEFRELAPFTYYDFVFDVSRTGNPNLRTPQIHNVDARFEWYPSKTELISLAAFYKYFKDPIEAVIRYAGSGIAFTYGNALNATSTGVELEVRKSFTELSESPFIQNLNVVLNASVISSNVKLGPEFPGQESDRPLQGQSPYIVNAGLYYNDVDRNWQVNVLYNVIGPRIFQVGDKDISPTIYEMPRNVIDLNLIKGLGKHFELKVGIQDILNQKFRLIQDLNRDRKITGGDGDYQIYRRGTYSTVGLTYRF